MLKRFVLGVIAAVMTAAPAYSDLMPITPCGSRGGIMIPGASLTLSPSRIEANTLDLAINAEVPGKHFYYLAEMSGDDICGFIDSSSGILPKGLHTFSITLPVPEEGRSASYEVNASFTPKNFYRNNHSNVKFVRRVTVRKAGGKNYIVIEN